MTAACLLAACGTADGGDARAAAPDSAAVPSAAAPADSPLATTRTPAEASDWTFRPHGTRPGVVDSIVVTRGTRPVQALVPGENHVEPETGVERISRPDLDRDGHPDPAFVTELAMANSRSHYWRFDPASARFTDAGVRETLHPDSAARAWTTFNRGGHGGRLWRASRWRWMDGALAEVRREEQDVLEDGATYVRVVRERRGGALAETSRDTLDEAQLRAGPSWMEP
ncbi:MAG TPA: hypothetical protein VF142_06110 [Longimicrobium sp.]